MRFVKYRNRKIYDVTNSKYVNLAELERLARIGQAITVTDYVTNVDITDLVLKSASHSLALRAFKTSTTQQVEG